jgi:hypothetical protein
LQATACCAILFSYAAREDSGLINKQAQRAYYSFTKHPVYLSGLRLTCICYSKLLEQTAGRSGKKVKYSCN